MIVEFKQNEIFEDVFENIKTLTMNFYAISWKILQRCISPMKILFVISILIRRCFVCFYGKT